mmetsp:Transcript_24849/g.98663  ORF Transcript_24849/g.98663 Transcript_24849/m.98663 type:complete len:290 (+) Transcript_24849:323-1192(+)
MVILRNSSPTLEQKTPRRPVRGLAEDGRADEGRRDGEEVEVGVELAADALDDGDADDRVREGRVEADAVPVAEREDVADEVGDAQPAERERGGVLVCIVGRREDGIDERGDLVDEGVGVGALLLLGALQKQAARAAAVFVDEGVEEVEEVAPVGQAELDGEPGVEDDEVEIVGGDHLPSPRVVVGRRRPYEEVAGVHVAVGEVVDEEHAQEAAQPAARERVARGGVRIDEAHRFPHRRPRLERLDQNSAVAGVAGEEHVGHDDALRRVRAEPSESGGFGDHRDGRPHKI